MLRGPQGTIFGKNTIAGAFNITTMRPQDVVHAAANIELGNYGLARFQGYVTGPLVGDVLAGEISLGYVRRDGFYTHLSGGPDGDSLDLLSYRTSLYFRPNPDSEFVLTADGLHDTGRAAFFQVTDLAMATTPHALTQETTPLRIDNNRPDYLHRDNYGVSLTASQKLPFGALTSITAYRHSAYAASLDDDQNQVDYVTGDFWGDRTRYWMEDLRLNGTMGPNIDYIAGLYYLGQDISTDRRIALGPDLYSFFQAHSGSPPGDRCIAMITPPTEISITTSWRPGRRRSACGFRRKTSRPISPRAAQPGYPSITSQNGASNSDLSPTGSLSYQVTPDLMTYARIARGFKSAAFNVDIVGSNQGLAAGPENATSFEVGLKSDLMNGGARLNGAVFHTDYNDLQVTQLSGSAVYLTNAAAAVIDGAELEMSVFATPDLRIDLGAGRAGCAL